MLNYIWSSGWKHHIVTFANGAVQNGLQTFRRVPQWPICHSLKNQPLRVFLWPNSEFLNLRNGHDVKIGLQPLKPPEENPTWNHSLNFQPPRLLLLPMLSLRIGMEEKHHYPTISIRSNSRFSTNPVLPPLVTGRLLWQRLEYIVVENVEREQGKQL